MMNRLIVVMLSFVLLMQAAILYRGYSSRVSSNSLPSVREAPADSKIEMRDHPLEGAADAKIVLVEFSDYECPYCKRHATQVGPQLHREFVESGRIRHVFVNNPLENHPNARFLAGSAICAGKQDAYWKMSARIFSSTLKTRTEMTSLAAELGLDSKAFEKCLDGPDLSTTIDRDLQTGKSLDVSVTPTFALGRIDSSNRVKVDTFIMGAQPIEIFRSAIEAAVKKPALE
jgi:protein-disulfide isomerase